jgi:hypothetical protein
MFNSPDRLFDRTWRPGHPFRPRLSSGRRWTMATAFVLLCTVIGTYWFVTDTTRVRLMAESYLSTLVGGPVTVKEATLSIFEGLRLDGVKVFVDDQKRTDSQLFSASSFIIEYNPRALFAGRIEATRIVAIEPRVFLTEDVKTGHWNYERLNSDPNRASRGLNISVLPEIVLRNAQVQYSRLQEQRNIDRGSMTIEGQLTPVAERRYAFQFQSLGKRQGVGPLIRGEVALGGGQITAELLNFEFGEDIKAMLPVPVLRWCEEHQLAGRMDVEDLSITPRPGQADPAFRARIRVQGVKLSVRPEEWMGTAEIGRLNSLRNSYDVMRLGGLNSNRFVDRLSALTEPTPVQLKDVYAVFHFTEKGIRIEDLTGKLEDIAFKIDGVIDGYSPSATANLRVASLETRNVEIPASPRYITSMPPAVREVYERFRPRGTCSFWVNLKRPVAGERPRITGEINIIDGEFVFEKFPYPLQNATGKIVLLYDDSRDRESLRIERIRGRGLESGPNAGSVVEINGEMGPFTSEVSVDMTVNGTDIRSEPLLISAFPPQTREALKIFDAPGKGEFPRFRGDFVCRIVRLPKRESHWIIETDIELADATGILVAFPYPMSGVSGTVKIRDDNLEIVNARMTRGDATLRVDGVVHWGRPGNRQPDEMRPDGTPRPPAMRPNIRVSARNVPIDEDLLNALPEDRRFWLRRLGAKGKFDLDGTLKVARGDDGQSSGELEFDFKIGLKDGTILPREGNFALTDVNGRLRLTPHELIISELSGRRRDAHVSGSGSVGWPEGRAPRVMLHVEARDLPLDSALYDMLPEAAQRGWNEVRPEGTVDASLNYSGEVARSAGPTTHPAAGGFELTITPKHLSAMPAVVPYRLEQLAGRITVLPDKVIVQDVTAKHGDATIRIAATGSTDRDAAWDFQIRGDDVPVDADLRKAAPAALADLLASLQMKGKVDFEFSKLHVRNAADAGAAPPARERAGPTTRSTNPVDVDFAVRLSTESASMAVGVGLADVHGEAEFTGNTRGGKLSELTGKINVGSLTLAGRPASNLRATFFKPPEHQAIQISRMEVQVADGTLAGQVDYAFPDDGPSRYAVALVLRNADVKKMTGQLDQDIRGQLTASLNLEGTYDDPASRRGRGDVSVSGQQLYKIPLLLGLLQITELALPISGPFREGSARYSIDGQRVTFEQIELRSKEMLMQGDGWLDFAKKQVRMTFVTDARGWPKLPLIGDLMQGARNELLQIHVRGTLQEPKVSASSFNILTTTIDEVFKGEQREASRD